MHTAALAAAILASRSVLVGWLIRCVLRTCTSKLGSPSPRLSLHSPPYLPACPPASSLACML